MAITGTAIATAFLASALSFGAQTTVKATAKGAEWGVVKAYHALHKSAKATEKVAVHVAK